MTEPVDATLPLRRAFVRVGGRAVVQHQLDIAIAAGCERLICFVRSLEPEVVALQKRAEAAGMQFNTVTSSRDLSALISAQDDVVVIYEGLLADPANAVTLIEQGTGVFVQPVEVGLAAGFERIDINHASAGMMRIPGHLIEQLVQMPSDCDISSTLTRIALQSRIALREVPPVSFGGSGWQIITSESQAQAIESEWISRSLRSPRQSSPGRRFARYVVITFGSSLLHAGNATAMMVTIVLAFLLLALGVGWFGLQTGGFLLAAIAWLALSCGKLLRRLEKPQVIGEFRPDVTLTALDWIFDGLLVLLIHWAAPPLAGTPILPTLAMPITLLLLVRISGRISGLPAGAIIADRLVLCLILAAGAVLGVVDWLIALGSIGLAGVILIITGPRSS